MSKKSITGEKPVTEDKLHQARGGPFPAVFPKEKRAPVRVRVWLPRFGADLMIGVLGKGGVPTKSKSLGTRDPKKAEQEAWRLVNLAASAPKVVKEAEPEILRIGGLVTRYLASPEFETLTDRHRKDKKAMLEKWMRFLGATTPVASLRKETVKRHLESRR